MKNSGTIPSNLNLSGSNKGVAAIGGMRKTAIKKNKAKEIKEI